MRAGTTFSGDSAFTGAFLTVVEVFPGNLEPTFLGGFTLLAEPTLLPKVKRLVLLADDVDVFLVLDALLAPLPFELPFELAFELASDFADDGRDLKVREALPFELASEFEDDRKDPVDPVEPPRRIREFFAIASFLALFFAFASLVAKVSV